MKTRNISIRFQKTDVFQKPTFGIALLAAVLAALIVSISASVVLLKVERESKVERIKDYNFIVESYRTAILLFRRKYNHFPKALEELLENSAGIQFLRRLYPDPFTGGPLNTKRNLSGEIEDVYSEAAARLSQEY